MTEVSEVSNDNSIALAQAISPTQTNSLTIPSIKTRRAETTLEIPSGGAMAMAGLIQDPDQAGDQRLSGSVARKPPVLGPLRPQPRLRRQPVRADEFWSHPM